MRQKLSSLGTRGKRGKSWKEGSGEKWAPGEKLINVTNIFAVEVSVLTSVVRDEVFTRLLL